MGEFGTKTVLVVLLVGIVVGSALSLLAILAVEDVPGGEVGVVQILPDETLARSINESLNEMLDRIGEPRFSVFEELAAIEVELRPQGSFHTFVGDSLDSLQTDIQTAVGSAQTAISTEIDSAKDSIDAVEAALQGEIQGLSADLAALSSRFQGFQTLLSQVNSTVVSEFASLSEGLTTGLGLIQGGISSLADDVSSLTDDVSSLIGEIALLSGGLEDLQTSVDEALAGLGGVQLDLSELSGGVGVVQTDVTDLLARIGEPSSTVFSLLGDILTQLGNVETMIAAIDLDFTALIQQIQSLAAALNEAVAAILAAINQAEASIQQSLSQGFSSLSSQISALSSQISALGSSIGGIHGRLTTISNELYSRLATLTSMLTSLGLTQKEYPASAEILPALEIPQSISFYLLPTFGGQRINVTSMSVTVATGNESDVDVTIDHQDLGVYLITVDDAYGPNFLYGYYMIIVEWSYTDPATSHTYYGTDYPGELFFEGGG